MLKQKVTVSELVPLTDEIKNSANFNEDLVIGDLYEKETEKIVRFRYTLAAIRNYKTKHDREFLNDYGKATKEFTEVLKSANIKDMDSLTTEQQLGLIEMVNNPVILNFIMALIPCMYVEVHDGKFIQNEATIETAETSDWFMDLVNIEFFTEVFSEITANMGPAVSKTATLSVAK